MPSSRDAAAAAAAERSPVRAVQIETPSEVHSKVRCMGTSPVLQRKQVRIGFPGPLEDN